jgi:hypothetical protein
MKPEQMQKKEKSAFASKEKAGRRFSGLFKEKKA